MTEPHGDLCFGCGQANLFGLQLEDGRFFVKQDHQGPDGAAHPGIVVTALLDAMALAGVASDGFTVRLHAPAPVGQFVEVRAAADGASAHSGGELVAELAPAHQTG